MTNGVPYVRPVFTRSLLTQSSTPSACKALQIGITGWKPVLLMDGLFNLAHGTGVILAEDKATTRSPETGVVNWLRALRIPSLLPLLSIEVTT